MISRSDIVSLIGRTVKVIHAGGVDRELVIQDVGEHYLFTNREGTAGPGPAIPLAEISEILWVETTEHKIKAQPDA